LIASPVRLWLGLFDDDYLIKGIVSGYWYFSPLDAFTEA
jgi:hypothetical protein